MSSIFPFSQDVPQIDRSFFQARIADTGSCPERVDAAFGLAAVCLSSPAPAPLDLVPVSPEIHAGRLKSLARRALRAQGKDDSFTYSGMVRPG